MLKKLRWKLKFPLWAVTLLFTYLGCHLMVKLCLFSPFESFSSLCCFSATQAPNSFCSSCMPLYCSPFLIADFNEDHQATWLEKGTYFLALFTDLKQKLQFCKDFVNEVRKNSWDNVLFVHYNKPTSSEYAENLRSMSLLVVETIAKKYNKT